MISITIDPENMNILYFYGAFYNGSNHVLDHDAPGANFYNFKRVGGCVRKYFVCYETVASTVKQVKLMKTQGSIILFKLH